MRLGQVREADERERTWDYGVFLAVEDERLIEPGRGGRIGFMHRPGFQTTRFPCEMIWQGSWKKLTQAIEQGAFAGLGDAVNHLDRLFLIRVGQGKIDLARSPADLLGLDKPLRGQWYAVTADAPLDAWVHVRDHEPELAANGNLCEQTLTMPTKLVAFNGDELHQNTPIEVEGCPGAISFTAHSIKGHTLDVSVYAPGGGKLTLTGKGLKPVTKTVKHRETVALKLAQKRAGRLKTTGIATFTPSGGKTRKKQAKGLSVRFGR